MPIIPYLYKKPCPKKKEKKSDTKNNVPALPCTLGSKCLRPHWKL